MHDYAQESTLISFDQIMLDQTTEEVLFDQNFDNMSILEDCSNNQQGVLSELLREKGIIRGTQLISDDSNKQMAVDDDETPDKTCAEDEETKGPQTTIIDTCEP